MPTYVGFLRAINLGSTRKFPKDAVRASAEAAGFTDVETYLNTGNLCVTTRMRSLARVEDALESAFLADRGFEVPTIVFGQAELSELSEYAVGLGERSGPLQRHYISLLREAPSRKVMAAVEERSTDQTRIVVHGRSVNMMWSHATPGDVDPLGTSLAGALGLSSARTAKVLAEVSRRWC
ncbi:DUF1697 domain-containing protein [Ornithinimicrobium sp. F0845]|uniref:DUF1697 domain-containing protein n=1 Tax=Ornithinimicrobium sp. F0845 TaxID=2926412 RepID=UPI001FF6095C|nr:DUF1697 domain-containing protein [Ornithinimicrobium sp. F0845]MCK0113879.1 DUF1697 domain-containing protein [Ornithinimicrobium sp. F0845]